MGDFDFSIPDFSLSVPDFGAGLDFGGASDPFAGFDLGVDGLDTSMPSLGSFGDMGGGLPPEIADLTTGYDPLGQGTVSPELGGDIRSLAADMPSAGTGYGPLTGMLGGGGMDLLSKLLGAGGSAAGGAGGLLNRILSPGGLATGAMGAGGLGALASMLGKVPTQRPPAWRPEAQSAFQQALGMLQGAGQGAQTMWPGQLGLWQQGAGLLGQLGAGQMPGAFTDLTKQAFQPFVGSVTQQAIESARQRGFAGGADLLGAGGPASQIAGPALANLPGMEAQFQFNNIMPMIQALMGQGQQGLQNQQGVAQQFGALGSTVPMQQFPAPQPGMAQRLQGAAPWLQGGFSAANQLLNPPQQMGGQQPNRNDIWTMYGQ